MPRLPSRKAKDIARLLESRGFTLHRTRGSHAIYINFQSERMVVVPMHTRDLPKGTLLEILKQAGLSREDL